MGNCIDIPPPLQHKSHHVYFKAPRQVIVRKKMPYASGPLLIVPRGYPSNHRSAASDGLRQVTFHPVTGRAYAFPLESPVFTPVYLTDCGYFPSSNYGYRCNLTKRVPGYQKNIIRQGKQSLVEDGVTDREIERSHKLSPNYLISPGKIIVDLTPAIYAIPVVITCKTEVQRNNAQEDACHHDGISPDSTRNIFVSGSESNKSVLCQQLQNEDIHSIPTDLSKEDIFSITTEFSKEDIHSIPTDLSKEDIFSITTEFSKEDIVSITTEFSKEDAFSDTNAAFQDQQIDVLVVTDTSVEEEYSTQEIFGEPDRQSTVAVDAPRMLAAPDWTESPVSDKSAKDVVLSYHSADSDAMMEIKHKLQVAGVKAAVSYPADDTRTDALTTWLMFPQTITDAKVMIVLLSQASVRDNHIKDEVCLAQVTETFIYPVALEKSQDLLAAMTSDMKLQVACYKWTQLDGDTDSDSDLALMVRRLKEDLVFVSGSNDPHGTRELATRRRKIFYQRQAQNMITFGGHMTAAQYWHKRYGNDVNVVSWDRFQRDLFNEYQSQMSSANGGSFSRSFTESLKREVGVGHDNAVFKAHFVEFCTMLDTEQDVLQRVYCVNREIHAFREVLSVESTVRTVAIENIGKFGNKNAIAALLELMADKNPNIRASTTTSLSRSLAEGDAVTMAAIMAALDDSCELVREAGCLALGHLGTKKAIKKLKNICGNDTKPHVREAAAVALSEIKRSVHGGGNNIPALSVH